MWEASSTSSWPFWATSWRTSEFPAQARTSALSTKNINCDIMSQLIFLFRHKFQVMTRMGFDGRRRGCVWSLALPNPDGRHTEYQLFHYGTVDIFRHMPNMFRRLSMRMRVEPCLAAVDNLHAPSSGLLPRSRGIPPRLHTVPLREYRCFQRRGPCGGGMEGCCSTCGRLACPNRRADSRKR